jgi:hypothetical protein
MNYYTYAYLRKDRTPYYIGKGKGKRIYSKSKRCKPPKDKLRIIFLKQNLTEDEAFKHEKYMIAVLGRKDLGTGILHNLTDGGDGVPNWGTSEQRSEIAKKRQASMTPEQRSEIARKGRASLTPEQRREIRRKGLASTTPEQRSESMRKKAANKTSEQRSESAKKGQAKLTPQQRSERARKGRASLTQKQRSGIARKAGLKGGVITSNQRWQCTETGFITNAGNLSRYQKKRGIDTSKRIKLS